jgi:hypothetical protein
MDTDRPLYAVIAEARDTMNETRRIIERSEEICRIALAVTRSRPRATTLADVRGLRLLPQIAPPAISETRRMRDADTGPPRESCREAG